MHDNIKSSQFDFTSPRLISTSLCISDAETTLGAPAVWRAKEDIVQKAVLLVDPSMRALQAGVLVGWNVFTARGRRSQRVYLQVWRPVDVNRRAYRLVGETKIAALWVGHSFFPLRPPDRILVEPGDVLGLHFPRFNPIPWSPVPCDRNNEHFFKYNPSRLLAMKGTIVFDRPAHDWMPCRNYSFNASIMTTRGQLMFMIDAV
ncbi:hypothetical protein CAPTEDRAFT_200978 [Capitella teleta]|uniref:Uncharacterized protein n=1 Tax=Capitella teleta TaxID=283909 RepID=R7TJ84_CAPTE|nr:hypothetical protein CAPTEDRAFT_200978 [Capitella teleta]|eukprot:ELT93557.1 hypothetical protein CAPTEDRAFT_200978 [Capitella teleta]